MRRSTGLLFSFSVAVHAGCFSPSSGSTASDDTGATDGTADDTGMPPTTTATTMAPSTTNNPDDGATTGPSTCGDGTMQGGEECDDGEDNSDRLPNACRTDCRLAHCGDMIIDSGEQCDNGDANSDTVADACRTTCRPPSCGDMAVDSNEACDDGNPDWGDSCYQCQSRFYFILNAPSTNSSGDDSIVRITRGGPAPMMFLGGDPAYNGMREIEVEPDGSALYAMQSHFSLMQHRVLVLDPLTGDTIDEIAVNQGTLGIDVSLTAMARGVNGLLYITALESAANNIHFVAVDPDNGTVDNTFSWNFAVQIGDMTADDEGWFYVTNLTDTLVYRVQPAFTEVGIWADASSGLDSPFGITWDAATGEVWVGNSRPSIEAQLVRFDATGQGGVYATIAGYNQPQLRGLIVDDGVPLAPLGEANVVVSVAPDGTPTTVFDNQIQYPVDIKIVDLAR